MCVKHVATKWLFLAVIVAAIILIVMSDAADMLSLSYIQEHQQMLEMQFARHPWIFMLGYIATYIVVTALSIPGATILTLLGGFIFGLVNGVVAVSFASTIGASLAFLLSRFLFKDWVEAKYAKALKIINKGIDNEGAFYLFAMRLMPLFPFFMVNILCGLTRIRLWVFFVVSQVGMLPATIIYVFAGTQLATIKQLSDITSPGMLGALMLLGVLPLLAKKMVEVIRKSRILKPYEKPDDFDYNLIVIGGGAAGLVSSYIAATVKAKILLIEKHHMGGDCLNTGCVPSKTFIRSAKLLHDIARAEEFGLDKIRPKANFKQVMQRVRQSVKAIEPHDSVERYTALGVECANAYADILDPYHVQIEDRVVSTRSIIIATGATPNVPPIEGLEDINYVTSDTIWDLEVLPKEFVVLGGGAIGCELAQSFSRLGSKVTIIEATDQLLPKEDVWVSEALVERYKSEGITVLTDHTLVRCRSGGVVVHNSEGHEFVLGCDVLLIALGRRANISGFGLENLPIEYNDDGTIQVNAYMQTNIPMIYACGDVAGPYQFTHMAAHQAWYASVNALFGVFKRFKVDYSVVPVVIYSDPMVARVGVNQKQAQDDGVEYEVTEYDISDLDRAIIEGHAYGKVEVITKKGKDHILGVTIVATQADTMLAPWVMAMKYKLGLNKLLSTIVAYPTWSEASKYVAGVWRQARKPQKLLNVIAWYHRRRRRQ